MIYNALLLLSLLFVLPKWLIQKKYRGTVLQRLGLKKPSTTPAKPVIWIHMCSLGETKAMATLYKELKAKHPHGAFYLSSTTKTGHEEAKRSLPHATDYFFLPLDLSWLANALVNHIHPSLFILSEGEFWPHTLAAVKKKGGKILLLNGKISERSSKRFSYFTSIASQCFDPIDHFFVQNQEYAARFQQLKVPSHKISITGNLKLTTSPPTLTPEEKAQLQRKWGLTSEDLVITLASTHSGEEEALLPLIPAHAKVLIAPRHPERFQAVKKLLTNPQWVLIDEMGQLPYCYQLSHLAIVGGSFIPGVGGHNIFEPIQAHIPVLFGHYMHTQQELVTLILNAGAGIQTSLDTLPQAIERGLTLHLQAQNLAQVMEKRGEEIYKQILPFITC